MKSNINIGIVCCSCFLFGCNTVSCTTADATYESDGTSDSNGEGPFDSTTDSVDALDSYNELVIWDSIDLEVIIGDTIGDVPDWGPDGTCYCPGCTDLPDDTNCIQICYEGGCSMVCVETDCSQTCVGGGCELKCLSEDNCSQSCGGGGCSQECYSEDCYMTCDGGGCEQSCGSDNCALHCPGGGCTQSCYGPGDCIVECPGSGCEQFCDGEFCLTSSIRGRIECHAQVCRIQLGTSSYQMNCLDNRYDCVQAIIDGDCYARCAGPCIVSATDTNECAVICSDDTAATECYIPTGNAYTCEIPCPDYP